MNRTWSRNPRTEMSPNRRALSASERRRSLPVVASIHNTQSRAEHLFELRRRLFASQCCLMEGDSSQRDRRTVWPDAHPTHSKMNCIRKHREIPPWRRHIIPDALYPLGQRHSCNSSLDGKQRHLKPSLSGTFTAYTAEIPSQMISLLPSVLCKNLVKRK